MFTRQIPAVLYGGDYNPDQWDETTWQQDMEFFRKAHINLVTLPVFSWAKLEPEEGRYDFSWLDAILDLLKCHGIKVWLATPTAAQPAWLSKKYPDVLPVDIAGRKRTHGMRLFFCINSPNYRKRAAALAEALAVRYKNYEGLVGWHVANEYKTYCYCETCQQKFRIWLENRYGDIATLNDRWHTAFWGRTVYAFDEIMLPTELNDDYRFNPAIQLDYLRFMSDATIECYLNEARILKAHTPDLPVLTNITGFIKKLDLFKFFSHADYAGWDNYPSPTDAPSLIALKHDIMRGLKDGNAYIIAEQSPNQQNWQPYNKLKKPGEVRLLAYQGLAHGADGCLFFQMRQSIAGAEKFHGAVISHAATDKTRIFQECAQLGVELYRLGDRFLDGKTHSKVGLLFDWENWWALELSSGPTKDMNYLAQVHLYYDAFYAQNVAVDVLKYSSDFTPYTVIVAPLLYMLKPGLSDRLKTFVKNGGTLIATYMSGLVDENDRCVFGAYPGELSDVLGIWVEETDALFPEEQNVICIAENTDPFGQLAGEYACGFLCDVIHPKTARVIGTYKHDFYSGLPCFTANAFGKGTAYYFGAAPEPRLLNAFVKGLRDTLDLHCGIETDPNVEIRTRVNRHGETTFIMNHNPTSAAVDFGPTTYRNLLNDTTVTGKYLLEGRAVMVLEKTVLA